RQCKAFLRNVVATRKTGATMLNVKGRGLAAVAVLLGMCTQASAGDERIIYASLGETTRAPIGWVEFCAENPGECRGGTTQPRDIVMSQTAWRGLLRGGEWGKARTNTH